MLGPARNRLLLGDINENWTTLPRTADDPVAQRLSHFQAICTVATTMIGVGVLGVPYSFARGGPALSSIVCALVTAAMMRTAVMLVRCMEEAQRIKFATTGDRTPVENFGELAKIAGFPACCVGWINACCTLELGGALIKYFVLIALNTAVVIDGFNSDAAIAIGVVLVCLLFKAPRRCVEPLAVASVVGCAAVVAALIASGACMGMDNWYVAVAGKTEPPLQLFIWSGLFQDVGSHLFCFSGHPCLTSIRKAVAEPRRFSAAASCAVLGTGCYYFLCAIAAYVLFGPKIAQSFTASLGLDLAGRPVASGAAAALLQRGPAAIFVFALVTSAPGLGQPVLDTLGCSGTVAQVALMAFSGLVAKYLQKEFALAMAVTGLLATMATSVLFPIALHVALMKLTLCWKVVYGAAFAGGVGFALYGTAFMIYQLVEGGSKAGNGV